MLTKADLGPKRRAFDKLVRAVVLFLLGWIACEFYWDVQAVPGLKDSSASWFQATSDKFSGICSLMYGAAKVPDPATELAPQSDWP